MSFFDEVETTVANTRFLQAVEDNAPIKLDLAPYEELRELDQKLKSRLTLQILLKPSTIANYQFTRFLKEIGYQEIIAFLERLRLFENGSPEDSAERGMSLYSDFLRLKNRQPREKRKSGEGGEAGGGGGGKDPKDPIEEGGVGGSVNTHRSSTLAAAGSASGGSGDNLSKEKDEKKENGEREKIAGKEAASSSVASSSGSPSSSTSTTTTTTTTATTSSSSPALAGPAAPTAAGANDESGKFIFHLLNKYPNLLDQVDDEMLQTERAALEGKNRPLNNRVFDPVAAAVEDLLSGLIAAFVGSEHWRRYVQVEHYARQPVKLNDFRVFRVLGRGAFGAVSAVQKIDTHAIFAMKEMGKKQVKATQSEWMVVNEKKVLSCMRSPFVLNLKYSFHTEESLYLIFDMCSGGDLKFHLRNLQGSRSGFEPERARFYAAEVLLGLEHIHSLDIVYRDLKPNNILLDNDGHAKISDLGLAVKLRKNKVLKHLAGTAGYWAPEVVSKQGTYKSSDFWSFGVFLYEMLCGRRPTCLCGRKTKEWCPFGQKPEMEVNALDEEGKLTIKVDYPPDKFSPEAIDLLQKLFEPDPRKRLGAEGAQEIKAHPYFAEMNWKKMELQEIKPPWIPDSRTVNANSIAEVGEFNKTKFKKIKITPEDDKYYDNFTYISEEGVERELAQALAKQDNPPESPEQSAPQPASGACCAVL